MNAVYGWTCLITSADKCHLTALDPARLDRAAAAQFFDGESFEMCFNARRSCRRRLPDASTRARR